MYLALYVDDFFVFYNDKEIVNILKDKFKIKDLGPVSYALGIQINRNREAGIIELSQKQYTLSVLERFGMVESKPVGTPLDKNVKFSDDLTRIDNVPYQELIGSLMYLAVSTRPDISFAVSFLSQFNNSHTTEHWSAAKRVLRYLKGTIDLNLTYVRDKMFLIGYTDADWGNDVSDRKSFSGIMFKLSGGSITWGCRKQTSTALSSTEAEYKAISEAGKEAVYLRALLTEILQNPNDILGFNKGIVIYNDNQSAQKIVSNQVFHKRTKHIAVKYHYIRELVSNKQIDLKYMPGTEMVADICTKPLPVAKHVFCTENLGLV